MPDIKNNIKTIYKALTSEGYKDLGTEQDFANAMQHEEDRKTAYKLLQEHGYSGFGKDEKEFSSFVYEQPKTENVGNVKPVKPVEPAKIDPRFVSPNVGNPTEEQPIMKGIYNDSGTSLPKDYNSANAFLANTDKNYKAKDYIPEADKPVKLYGENSNMGEAYNLIYDIYDEAYKKDDPAKIGEAANIARSMGLDNEQSEKALTYVHGLYSQNVAKSMADYMYSKMNNGDPLYALQEVYYTDDFQKKLRDTTNRLGLSNTQGFVERFLKPAMQRKLERENGFTGSVNFAIHSADDEVGKRVGVFNERKAEEERLKAQAEKYKVLGEKLEHEGEEATDRPWWIDFAAATTGGLGTHELQRDAVKDDKYGYQKLAAGRAMRYFAEDALEAINEDNILHTRDTKGVTNYIKGTLSRMWRGGKSTATDLRTWDFGFTDLSNAAAVMNANEALKKGVATADQKALLNAAALYNVAMSKHGAALEGMYGAVGTSVEMILVMLQMAANPASGLGKGTQKMVQDFAIKGLTKRFGKYATDATLKTIARGIGYAGRFVGDIGEGAALTLAYGMPAVAADATNRQIGDVQAAVDKKGNVVFNGTRNGETAGKAFAKAFTAHTIDNQSELVGEYFGPILNYVNKGVTKGLNKIGLTKVTDFITGLSNKQITNGFNRFMKKTHWNGFGGEYAEEVFGNFENALTVGDLNLNLDVNDDHSVFSKRLNWNTSLGVFVGSGFLSGIHTASYLRNIRKINTAIADADTSADVVLGTERWNNIKEQIDNATADNAAQVMTNIATNEELSEKQAKPIYEYAKNTFVKHGLEIARLKDAVEGNISSTQAEIENQNENGRNAQGGLRTTFKNEFEQAEQKLNSTFDEETINGINSVENADEFVKSDAYNGFSEEEKKVALDYLNAKSAYEGMIERVQDDIHNAISRGTAEVDQLTHKDSGEIVPITLKENDQEVYVISGNVVMTDNGSVVDYEKSDKTLIVFNPVIGKQEMIDAHAVLNIGERVNAEQRKAELKETITQTEAERVANEIETPPTTFEYEQQVKVLDSEGNLIDGVVQEVQGDDVVVVSDAFKGGKVYKAEELAQMQPQTEQPQTEQQPTEQQEPQPTSENNQQQAVFMSDKSDRSDKSDNNQNAQAESDAIPTDDDGNVLYERVPIERTIRDLFDGSLDDAEVKAFVAANVEAAQRAHDKISNKPPKISTNKQKYLEAKAKWQGQVKAAKEKLDYWNAVEAERQKLTHTTDEEVETNERELSGEAAREDYRNNADTNMEVHTAEDLARSFLHGAKITPESFREETGLGVAEQRKFVGMISNQGKSIARLGEDLVEIDNTEYGGVLFFRGDTSDARSAIIDALMGSYSRKDLKSSSNTFEDKYAEEIERQRDEWYYNAYHMTYEEYLQYEATIIPEYLRKYANFDEDYFYSRCHEAFYDEMERRQTASNNENVEENGEQGNDTHREEQGITQSNPILQAEEVDNQRGDSQSQKQGGAVPISSESEIKNGTLPQSTPTEVDEPQPIGNSFFGKVYNQFKGKAKEAVNFLMRHRSGKLLGVFHRNDIGEISLVWGDEKGGLAHIISKHIVEQNDFNNIDDVINTMQQVINNGTITRENKDKVVIDYNDYRVAIRKQTRDNNGNVVEQGNWIVTAFDKSRSKKDKTPSEKTLSTPPSNQETDGVTLPSNGVPADKVTQSSQTKQEKENKFSPTPRKDGESITDYAERVAEEHQAKRTLKEEEAKVDTNPTEAQKEAGNYRKGHIKVDGMDVTIEQPKGSVRRGKDAYGKEWESKMHNTYGYIRGTESVDGDHIDIFLSDTPETGNVFVIDQVNKDGSFDEHKVMYGFSDMESAKKAYLSNYEDGWQGLGNITEVSKEEFKKWIDSSKRKTKPFAEYSSVKTEGDVKVEHPIESSKRTKPETKE